MNRRVLALVCPALMLVAAEAAGQWMFLPPQAADETGKQLGDAAAHLMQPAAPVAPPAMIQTVPTSNQEWDQSGVIGRRDRDAQWRHEEAMTGIYQYLQGVRDSINAMRPGWGPRPPQHPPASPLQHGNWRKP